MREKAKELGTWALGAAVVIGVLALPVVFIGGSLWASEHLLRPLIVIGWIALALDSLILLPLSLFRAVRGFTGATIFLSSFVFGLVCWLLAFILTYVLWGIWPVVVGILFFGGGVVPIALLATAFKGAWHAFLTLLVLIAITFGSRIIGVIIAESSNG